MKIIITEEQERLLLGLMLLEEKTYPINPTQVLLVKKYLDQHFKVQEVEDKDKMVKTISKIGPKGTAYAYATKDDVFYELEEKFKNMFVEKDERTKFLKQVINDWFNSKITKEGLLSVNHI